MGLLDGKVAVITGAGSGMARAAAEIFVREGAKVVAGDISGAEKDTAAELGASVVPFHCDVTKEAEVEALVRAAVDEFGRFDAMLNVAGLADAMMLADVTTEHYDKLMDVDLRGVLYGMKHAVKVMLETETAGAIVNWSSLGGMNGSYFTSVYSAAKAGVIALSKAAAIEYGAQGIRVNCLCPGDVDTPMLGREARDRGLKWDDYIRGAANRPLGRVGTPEELARAALFLASDDSSFMTGAALVVDGGGVAD